MEQVKRRSSAAAHLEALADLRLTLEVQAAKVLGSLGDDVDHAEHRVGAVEHGAGAENDLDVIDELHRHVEPSIEARRARQLLVDGMAIDEEKDRRVALAHS